MGSYRDHDSRYASGDNDNGYRTTLRSYGAGAGPRRLEVVKGNVYSASQTYVASEQLQRPTADPPSCPPPQLYPPPPSRSSRSEERGAGRGGGLLACFNDPEIKRRRRVAKYKAYGAEGKLKASLRKGLRWVKRKCSELVHGF